MRWWCCSLLCVLQRFNLCDVVIKAVTSDRPYRCSECGKTFTSPTSLRIHLKIHSEDKPHQCSVCGKRFLWLCVLKRHQVVHKGESATSDPDSPGDPEQGQKPYLDPKRLHLCSECGKRFTTAPLLKSHMKSHSGEIHHQCSVCGKCFLLFQDLKRHQEIHKGERDTGRSTKVRETPGRSTKVRETPGDPQR
nr:zinc finger protein 22-like isoform X2 [Oncorhynchus nerka]